MSQAKPTPAASKQRLVSVTLDEESIGRSNPDVEHERTIAIYDLLEMNHFAPVGHPGGPYALHLSINDNRLVFDIRLEDGTPLVAHLFSLSPLRRIDAVSMRMYGAGIRLVRHSLLQHAF